MRRGPSLALVIVVASIAAALAGCPRPAPEAARAKAKPQAPAIDNFFRYASISAIASGGRKILFTASHEAEGGIYLINYPDESHQAIVCSAAICQSLGYANFTLLYSRTENGASRIHYSRVGHDTVELPGQDGTTDKFLRFSSEGSYFYTTGNARDEHVLDLYEWDAATLKHRLVYKNDLKKPFFIGPISPDGGTAALTRSRGDRGDELRIRALATGREDAVPVRDGDMIEPLFFLDGTLYYLAYDGEDRRGIMRFKPGDREPERFLFDPSADYRQAAVSTEGDWTRILTVKSRDGSDELEHYDPRGNRTPITLPIKGQISSADFFADGKRMVYLNGTETSPAALYMQGPATSVEKLYNPDFKVAPGQMTTGTPQTIPARDGLSLPAFLYRPAATDRLPAVIWLHGGPGGEARREYAPHLQYLVSRGYIVLALNYRGSSGYGRAFLDADNRKHGGEVVDDVIAARDWLAARDCVDPQKIAVVGRSYGGYLALAALARAPEKFAAGVDLFGPSNWVTALEGLPPEALVYRPALYAEIGNPVADRDELRAISPVSFAEKIRGPLLIIQGATDSRVAGEDTTELVRRIRSNMGHVEYVYFVSEGHGFDHAPNEIRCWSRVREFLDLHLRGIRPPAAAARPAVFAQ